MANDYQMFRGRCREESERLAAEDPSLRVVRGWYHCPQWGRQAHWWCVRPDGSVVDPTALQFPSGGLGVYEEFDGNVECAECGASVPESDADIDGNYAFCSTKCHARFVGIM